MLGVVVTKKAGISGLGAYRGPLHHPPYNMVIVAHVYDMTYDYLTLGHKRQMYDMD